MPPAERAPAGVRRIAGQGAMDELASVVGEGASHDLARVYGGTSLYVPRAIADDHALCLLIGREASERLSAWTGGLTIAIPKQIERRARVLEQGRNGMGKAQIALATGFSERHVYRLLKEAGIHAAA